MKQNIRSKCGRTRKNIFINIKIIFKTKWLGIKIVFQKAEFENEILNSIYLELFYLIE